MLKRIGKVVLPIAGWFVVVSIIPALIWLGWSADHPDRYLIVTNGEYYCVAHQHGFWGSPQVYDWERCGTYSEADAKLKALTAKTRPWKETVE